MENITNQSIATHRGSAPLPQGRGGGESLQLFLAVLLVIFGILLIATAFICPPLGVIDPSVLTAYGETLTFAGSLIGLDYHYRFKQNNQAYET